MEKWILRQAFTDALPDEVLWREKEKFSRGAGSAHVVERIAEREITDAESPVSGNSETARSWPMSLVPMAALGQRFGVSTRAMEALIALGSMIHRTDYWRRGRTLDKLGIANLSVSELGRYVTEGVLPEDAAAR